MFKKSHISILLVLSLLFSLVSGFGLVYSEDTADTTHTADTVDTVEPNADEITPPQPELPEEPSDGDETPPHLDPEKEPSDGDETPPHLDLLGEPSDDNITPPNSNFADSFDAPFAEDSVLIRLAPQSSSSMRTMSFDLGVAVTEMRLLNPSCETDIGDGIMAFSEASPTQNNVFALTLEETGRDAVLNALEILNANPAVDIAEPNFLYEVGRVPNDYYFTTQYALTRINAAQAWDITTGSRSVVVGVIDTGIDGTHPDLIPNLWVNPNPNRNGFVNDIHGYNFTSYGSRTPVGGIPFDDQGHGTHVAGIIGAKGNNSIGTSGVNWDVSLAWLGISAGGNYLSADGAIAALNYANLNNIRITNNSWGGTGFSKLVYDAIRNYNGLFVVAAGNNGTNNDVTPTYPASYDLPNIISVAATNQSDNLSAFSPGASNFGPRSVDIAAPGSSILSTTRSSNYGYMSGTSMAAPHVAGVAALLLAQNNRLTTQQLIAAMKSTVRPVPALAGRIATGGIVDAGAALRAGVLVTTPTQPQSFTATAGNAQVVLAWAAPANNGGAAITRYEVSSDGGASWITASSGTGHTFTRLTNGMTYTFLVRAVNSAGAGLQAGVTATPLLPVVAPSVPLNFAASQGDRRISLSWTAPASNGGAPITSYLVSSNNGSTWVTATSSTGHTFTGLTNGVTYTFRVLAVNSAGAGTAASLSVRMLDAIEQFVARLYMEVLGRPHDENGLRDWSNLIRSRQLTGANAAYEFFFSREFLLRPLSDTQYVDILYRTLLNRNADTAGRAGWVETLALGWSREDIFSDFVHSVEFDILCRNSGIERGTYTPPQDRLTRSFVTRLYRTILGRPPDTTGLTDWTNALLRGEVTGAAAAHLFVFSPEFALRNVNDEQFISILYISMLGRGADPAGLAGWTGVLRSGTSRYNVFVQFVNSVEFGNICTTYGIIRGTAPPP